MKSFFFSNLCWYVLARVLPGFQTSELKDSNQFEHFETPLATQHSFNEAVPTLQVTGKSGASSR